MLTEPGQPEVDEDEAKPWELPKFKIFLSEALGTVIPSSSLISPSHRLPHTPPWSAHDSTRSFS